MVEITLEDGSSSSTLSMNSSEDAVNDNKNFNVLVVDDDPLIRMLHGMHLRPFGLKHQVAENGKEAVDLCGSGASFDLILMDKEMPVMNGMEATKELRAMGVKSMIVGITSRGSPYEMEVFKDAGLDYVFEKPLKPDIITFLMQQLNDKDNKDN